MEVYEYKRKLEEIGIRKIEDKYENYPKLSIVLNRLDSLNKDLDEEYFGINSPKYSSKRKARRSIREMEKCKDFLGNVIRIQRFVKIWLKRVNDEKKKYNIPKNDETLNNIIMDVKKMYKCNTITAIRKMNS